MTASISARMIEALTAIATGLRDIADAVRETHDTAALAKEATALRHKAAEHEGRMEKLEGEIAVALTEAESERDKAQTYAEVLQERIDATLNLADQWEAAQKANRESLERGELAVLHVPDPQDFRLAATGCLDVPPVDPRSVTETGPGATQTDSAGRGASGGLGERLRALVAEPDPEESQYESVDVAALVGLADEAHRLEVHARVVEQSLRTARAEGDGARIKGAQWKARYEETRDANRRVLEVAQWLRGQGQTGYARKVEEAVGGMEGALNADHPLGKVIGVIRECGTEYYKTEEAPAGNPFRLPEDRWPFQRGVVLEWPEDPQTVIDALEDAPVGVHVSDRFGNPWRRFPKGWAAPKSTSDGSNAPSSYLAGRAPITVTALADTEITP